MKLRLLLSALLMTGLVAFNVSCKKSSTTTNQSPATDTTIVKVNFSTSSNFTFFSFKNNAVVANTDSASSKWDFGLRLTTFLVNSYASGPGNAGVVMMNGILDNIIAAPATGYAYDTTASQLAIKEGSWYTYDFVTHSFSPIPGKIFIFRTADGHYAKMEILGVTYEPFVGPVPVILDYKIRFVYQSNGTLNF